MKLAYIDSSVRITRTEGLSSYKTKINQALQALGDDGWIFCSSDAVKLEVLIKPYKSNQHQLISIHNKIFENTYHLPSSPNVFKDALLISQTESLKAMDSIHVAIATHHNCKRFVSTDPNFKNLRVITPTWIDLTS